MYARFLMAATLCLLATAGLHAAPFLEVRATTTPPKIDGIIDDLAWRDAAHSDSFRQVYPEENFAPTEHTEFWITYDSDNVYVAVRSHDTAGLAGIRAYSMQHDQETDSDDFTRIVLDTFHRENDGYYFDLTAAGGKHEGLIQNKEEPNKQWDCIWYGKVTRDAGGWSAEFAIPLKSVAFDPANGNWGFNVSRVIRRKQEYVRWSGYMRTKTALFLPELGEIKGLTGLHQGRGIDLKPSASISHNSNPTGDEKTYEFKPSLDLVWHVTPSLAATLTINTDFADAEVDDRQVNLGRFALFYPEKRSFFTQDATLFTFGGIQTDPLPFFSRRIGLAEDGTQVNILAGLKLTGRAGPLTVGLLDVQTDAHEGVDSKNLLVGRTAFQVLDESSVGVIFTHGDPRINGKNTLVGADFNFANSHLADNKTLSAHASIQVTDSDYTGSRSAAGTFSITYPNEPFELNYSFTRIGTDFDPALGFVPRTGINQLHLWNRYRWYFQDHLINVIETTLETDNVSDLHWRPLEHTYWFPTFEADTRSGDYFYINYSEHREVLDAPFEIRPGIVIPDNNYRWNAVRIITGSTLSRPVDFRLNFSTGGFYSGHRTDTQLQLGWRPSPHFEFRVNGTLRQIRLPEGNFDSQLLAAKIIYTVTPDLQFSLLSQYDNFSELMGVNFRIKWTVKPGNDLYFIVNQGYDTEGDNFRPTKNVSSLKAAWTFRF